MCQHVTETNKLANYILLVRPFDMETERSKTALCQAQSAGATSIVGPEDCVFCILHPALAQMPTVEESSVAMPMFPAAGSFRITAGYYKFAVTAKSRPSHVEVLRNKS